MQVLIGNLRNTGYSTTTYNRLASAAGYTFTYDNEGNRLKRTRSSPSETVDYTWDHRNRLTKVEVKSGTTVIKSASFIYDVFDRRIGISISPDGLPTIPPTAERRFVYDRDHILLSFDSASNLTHRYMHGAMLDQILADDINGNIRWALTDNLGTVRDVVNSSGVVVNHNKYDSFGNITSQTSPGNNIRFAFTGREWDALIGLYFYRGRYYDPIVGRFINEDRIGFAGGDTNLYRYVKNSSVNTVDPFGLRPINGNETAVILRLRSLANETERANRQQSIDQNQGDPKDFARDLRRIADDLEQYIRQAKTAPENDPVGIRAVFWALEQALFNPASYSEEAIISSQGLEVRKFEKSQGGTCNRFIGDSFAFGANRRYGVGGLNGTYPTYPGSIKGYGYPINAADLANPDLFILSLPRIPKGRQKLGDIISFDTSRHYNLPPLTYAHTGILLNYGLYISARKGYTPTANGERDGAQISRIPYTYPYTFRRFLSSPY
jgi:RHS repeat-associated protein